MKSVKNAIQGLLGKLGYRVEISSIWLKYEWMKQHDVKTVLDIGANKGQSTRLFHSLFPAATIHAFEPIPSCWSELDCAFQNAEWFRLYRIAIGDEDAESIMFLNGYSPSSSLLAMCKLHKSAFPYTAKVSTIPVTVRKLDTVAGELSVEEELLIKMDVQGYESKVISGGQETLLRANILIIEVSFCELYRGQAIFDSIYSSLRNLGFVYVGNVGQLINPLDGRILQEDAVFVRNAK